MNIVVHDYAGHPFQVELSRVLAKRDHFVTHIYFSGDSGPKGEMCRLDSDSDTLKFCPIEINVAYSKTNFLKRRFDDIEYGKRVADFISSEKPDVFFSGNTPTEAQEIIVKACRRNNCKFIYWCQDFYSIAATEILKRKLSVFGAMIGFYYRFLERRQMIWADHIILITDRFFFQTDKWGISRSKISVIPNWGALDKIDVLDKSTSWSEANSLDPDLKRVLYSGTLGLKHNPDLLLTLASRNPEVEVLVIATGVGADYLQGLDSLPINLRVLPLQPFEVFAQVLSSADVFVAVIEKEAGKYSVPSKVLSYMCAGRPIVLSAPKENLSAKIVGDSGSGLVVEPDDPVAFATAVSSLLNDSAAMEKASKSARRYAEKHFKVEEIASKFETISLTCK